MDVGPERAKPTAWREPEPEVIPVMAVPSLKKYKDKNGTLLWSKNFNKKNFNIYRAFYADSDAESDARVTSIALPVTFIHKTWQFTYC